MEKKSIRYRRPTVAERNELIKEIAYWKAKANSEQQKAENHAATIELRDHELQLRSKHQSDLIKKVQENETIIQRQAMIIDKLIGFPVQKEKNVFHLHLKEKSIKPNHDFNIDNFVVTGADGSELNLSDEFNGVDDQGDLFSKHWEK